MKLIKLSSLTFADTFAKVDDEDFEYLNQFPWHKICYGYAIRSMRKHEQLPGTKRRSIIMHRVIMNPPDDMFIDHKDGDRLNNQKSNLRICTNLQNGRNRGKQKNKKSSNFKGVSWLKTQKRFSAVLVVNKKQIWLGYYHNEIDAAIAYNNAALKIDPEFFMLNEIPTLPAASLPSPATGGQDVS